MKTADFSEGSHVVQQWALAYGYKPYAYAKDENGSLIELISFPWWNEELEILQINVRVPNDPITIRTVDWPNLTIQVIDPKELRDEREDALAVWPAFGTRITWLDTMNLIIQRSARKAVRKWFDENYPLNKDGIR